MQRSITIILLAAANLLAGSAFAQASKDVNVVNTPTVNISPTQNRVVLGNDHSNPVAVMDVRPGRVPVQGHLGCILNGSVRQCTQSVYTVPEGKRLVVEQVALRTTAVPEGHYVSVTLTAPYEGTGSSFPIALTAVPQTLSSGESAVHFVANQPALIFCSAGRTLLLNAFGSVYFEAVQGSFSGYLEDGP